MLCSEGSVPVLGLRAVCASVESDERVCFGFRGVCSHVENLRHVCDPVGYGGFVCVLESAGLWVLMSLLGSKVCVCHF